MRKGELVTWKHPKDFEQRYIGGSDIATLILVGCRGEEGLKTEQLHFGGMEVIKAYIVTETSWNWKPLQ